MKRILSIITIAAFICASAFSGVQKNAGKPDSIYEIIKHKNIPASKKTEIIANGKIDGQDRQAAKRIWNVALEDSKKEKDINSLVYCYCRIANLTINENDEESVRETGLYLDSAEMYANKITDANTIAIYNFTQASYKQRTDLEKREAYNYYYKALFYYEKIGNEPKTVIKILFAIGGEASIREDTVSIKQIMAKAERLETGGATENNARLELLTTKLNSSLYKIRYKTIKKEYCIDSIIYYEKKIIDKYEANPKEQELTAEDAITSFLSIIEYEAKREKPDFKTLDLYIQKSEETAKQIRDTTYNNIAKIRMKFAKSLIEYRRNQFDIAQKHILRANELLSGYRGFGYRQMYADNYEQLEKICEAKGDYKGAIENENKKNEMLLEIRDNRIKMFELQYNNDLKKDEITKLDEQNKYQQTRKKQIIAICFLFASAVFLTFFILYNEHKSIKRNAILEKKGKEEAELQVKLKEEQAEQAQLEKYEALSDFHLQEMELIGKSKKLEQLKADKQMLDEQVAQFSNKISEYEKAIQAQDNDVSHDPLRDVIIEDLKQLIEKRIKDPKDYITKLENEIDENYINFIKKKYDGHITVQYIKYCICIAIGMNAGDINECFSIERASVHALKYRLKKKFGLDTDMNLDAFLMQNKNVSDANIASEETKD